nr:hypothetical protein [Tanacetum cinerariifolium]
MDLSKVIQSSTKRLHLHSARHRDYMGYLIRVADVKELGGANTNLKVLGKMVIKNLNKLMQSLIIRRDVATHGHQCNKLLFISRYSSFRRISIQYKAQHEENPPLEISKERCHDLEQEKLRNRFPLSTLMQQNPETYRHVRFTYDGAVIGVNTTRDCKGDRRHRLSLVSSTWTATESCIQAGISDGTATGQRHIFKFHYNLSCEKGKLSDTPGSGLNTPELQTPHLPAKETVHGQPPVSPIIISHFTTGHATIKTPTSTGPELTLKDTPDTSTEKTGLEFLGKKIHDETAQQGILSKKTSKRPLFQDEVEE